MDIKNLAGGAGLFGLGVLWGWAFTADSRELKNSERIENLEIALWSLRGEVVGLQRELQDATADVRFISEVEAEKAEEEEPEPTDAEIEASRSHLQSLIDTYTKNPEDRDTFVNAALSSTLESDTPPYVISRQKYSWDEEEGDAYDKITLVYYPRYRVLLDEDEEQIDEVATVVGWKNLTRFGSESEDPDVVYIRNRKMSTDFEVVREEESELPLHIKYGMPKDEFETHKAAGLIKLRPEDLD